MASYTFKTLFLLLTFSLATMKILQLNCSSFTKVLRKQLSDYIDHKGIDVILLQETWGRDQLQFKKWRPFINNASDGYGGVAIFSSPTIKVALVEELHDDNLEAIWVKVTINSQKHVILGSVYIRPGDHGKVAILEDKIEKIGDQPWLLMGDLNGRNVLWENGYEPNRTEDSYKMGCKLANLIVSHGAAIHNTGQHTFVHRATQNTSAIDLSFSKGFTGMTTRWVVDQWVVLKSDHRPTILEIEDEVLIPPKMKWDLKTADWEEWCKSLEESVITLIEEEALEEMSTDEKVSKLEEILITVSEEIIGKKEICKHSKCFYTTKLRELHKKLKDAKKKFKGRRDQKNLDILNKATEEYNTVYLDERKSFWKKVCEETTPKTLWETVNKILKRNKCSAIQPLRNDDGSYEFDDKEIARRLKEVHISRTGTSVSAQFDDNWKTYVEHEIETILEQEKNGLADPVEQYNIDIDTSEVRCAIEKLKPNSSPGPDGILPIMLLKGKNIVSPLLTLIYQEGWKEGRVPNRWKEDHKVFIPKDVPDPHTEKSLRPLSLASVVGKVDERVITVRLVWFLETQFQLDTRFLFDPTQYAYRRFRGVPQALLYLVSKIHEGFETGKHTVAAFVDLQGAFDSIWRKGLVYQLHQMGVRGRMLLYVNSYLEDRRSKMLVNTYTSDWIQSEIRVPQGSIISPILFISYVAHMTTSIPEELKYADDLSTWVTEINLTTAVEKLETRLDSISKWCNKWRLTINAGKTTVVCFQKKGHSDVTVKVGNQILKQVEFMKLLGTILDENLKFTRNTEHVREKSLKALYGITKILDEANGLRTAMGATLYKCIVFPHLSFSYPVWCTITENDLNSLEEVHRLALRFATGCHSSTATNVLEVLTGCPPLRIQLEEVLIHEYLRILRKPDNDPLREIIAKSSGSTSSKPSPAKLMKAAARDLSRKLDFNKLDPEPTYDPDHMKKVVIESSSIESWKEIGSSNSRTSQQIKLALESVSRHIQQLPPDCVSAFTDGSSLTNPGACGSAAVIYTSGIKHQPITIKKPISKRSTSFHAEVAAIELALNFMAEYVPSAPRPVGSIMIYTDCQSALNTVVGGNSNTYSKRLVTIDQSTRALKRRGIDVSLCWVPGHAGLHANPVRNKHFFDVFKTSE